LTLLDRNPHSPTMAALTLWQYKIDSSLAALEICLALALAYDTAVPDSPFYRQPMIQDWVEVVFSMPP